MVLYDNNAVIYKRGGEPIEQTIPVVNSRCNQCMIEHLSSYVIHSTAKQVTTRRRKNENVCEM